jgi:hypothetical protein
VLQRSIFVDFRVLQKIYQLFLIFLFLKTHDFPSNLDEKWDKKQSLLITFIKFEVFSHKNNYKFIDFHVL